MKNKKGFTLVELLAVVLILILMSLMSIIIVSKVTERSRMRAFIKEANVIAKGAINKYYDDKILDEKIRDDIYNGSKNGKVCYSISDNILGRYVVKDKKEKYSGSVEVCYAKDCKYQTKVWFTNGKGYYINGKTAFKDEDDVEHSLTAEHFNSCGYDTIGSYRGNTSVAEFDYKDYEQRFTILKSGYYRLEAWGAQGGNQKPNIGGFGAYASVEVELKEGNVLYINVGGQGLSDCTGTCQGGYNGGGSSATNWSSGGGATSIALESGLVSKITTKGKPSNLLIVAGGGAGVAYNEEGSYKNAIGIPASDWWNGRYVIGASSDNTSAGGGYRTVGTERVGNGGMSFIGNSKTKNGVIYCYKCTESTSVSNKAVSISNRSLEPKAKIAKIGNGYAKLTYLSSYQIAYNLDGGSLARGVTNPSGYSIESDPITLSNPTKNNYTFAGWSDGVNLFNRNQTAYKTGYYLASDGTEVQNNNYAIYEINVTPNTTYHLYNSGDTINPGYAIYDASGNKLVGSRYNYTKNISFTTPSNASYIRFSVVTNTSLNYYDRTTFRIEKVDQTLTIPTGSSGNKKFVARYVPIMYSIAYNLNGGSLAENVSNPTIYSHEYQNITLNNPTKAEYKFMGWTGSNGTNPQTSISIPRGTTGNKEYNAIFEKIYNLTFDYNIADYTFETTENSIMNSGFLIDYDEDFTIDISFNLPTASRRYLLIGNYGTSKNLNLEINANNKLRVYQDGDRTSDPAITIGEDTNAVLTYTASNKAVTYQYTSNSSNISVSGTFGASGYTGATLRLSQDYRGGTTFTGYTLKGLKITQKIAPSKFPTNVTLPGYTFDGWYTSQLGGTQVTQSNMSSYENQTIYAHWTQNT